MHRRKMCCRIAPSHSARKYCCRLADSPSILELGRRPRTSKSLSRGHRASLQVLLTIESIRSSCRQSCRPLNRLVQLQGMSVFGTPQGERLLITIGRMFGRQTKLHESRMPAFPVRQKAWSDLWCLLQTCRGEIVVAWISNGFR